MDLEQGKRFARLIPGSRRERVMLHERAKELELAAARRLDDDAAAGAPSDATASEAAAPRTRRVPVKRPVGDEDMPAESVSEEERAARMREILLALPQPEPDLASAVQGGMSGEELDALVRRVWARRQELLRVAASEAQTEGQLIEGGLAALTGAGRDDAALLPALADLEYHVSSAHNAEDFRKLGGFAAAVPLLNSTSGPVRAAAAWLVGSAVKYSPENQLEAVAMAAQLPLAATLGSAADAADAIAEACPSLDAACVREQLEPAARAAYALGALVRGAPPAVLDAAARSGAPAAAARAATALARAALRLPESPEAAGTLRAAAIKSLSVLSDLVASAGRAVEAAVAEKPPSAAAGGEGVTLTGEVGADGEGNVARAAARASLDGLEASLRQGPECAAAAHALAAAGAEGHGGARSEFMRRAVRAAHALPPPCRVALATARGLAEDEAEATMGAAVAALAAREAELMHEARGLGGNVAGPEDGESEEALDDFADAAAAADAAKEAGLVSELLRQARAGLEEAQRQAGRRAARA